MKHYIRDIIDTLLNHDIDRTTAVELINECYVGYKPRYEIGFSVWGRYDIIYEVTKVPTNVNDFYILSVPDYKSLEGVDFEILKSIELNAVEFENANNESFYLTSEIEKIQRMNSTVTK